MSTKLLKRCSPGNPLWAACLGAISAKLSFHHQLYATMLTASSETSAYVYVDSAKHVDQGIVTESLIGFLLIIQGKSLALVAYLQGNTPVKHALLEEAAQVIHGELAFSDSSLVVGEEALIKSLSDRVTQINPPFTLGEMISTHSNELPLVWEPSPSASFVKHTPDDIDTPFFFFWPSQNDIQVVAQICCEFMQEVNLPGSSCRPAPTPREFLDDAAKRISERRLLLCRNSVGVVVAAAGIAVDISNVVRLSHVLVRSGFRGRSLGASVVNELCRLVRRRNSNSRIVSKK
uniref:Uncharacterized protein n=1 Tax=Aplanochytrium stocchinoi TaxID=215587 RepID=A0A6S8D3K4_9STRA